LSQVEVDYTLNLLINEGTYTDLRKIEMTMMRMFTILNRIFPNSPVSKIIQDLQHTLMVLHQVQATIRAVELASGPIGWAYAGVSVAGTALTVYESTVGTY
jgi:uncharacterized protein YaaW (UPF0174 family)